jgi:hypothetical protein
MVVLHTSSLQLRPGAYNDETLIEFLTELHQLERQRTVLLIWDGLPSHRSRRMTEWLATQRELAEDRATPWLRPGPESD